MTNFIPIFPLEIVVYPGEALNLHIFEAKYKQLIQECYEEGRPFGIPSVINKKLKELGTLVRITEITKTYDNGEMDIKTVGISVFRILEIIKSIPDKLYCGAIVNYPENIENNGKKELLETVLKTIRELHILLNVSKDFHKQDVALTSYDLAHHAGLSMEEEYELLGLFQEAQRQEYLKRHLANVIPMVQEMEHLKEKIRQNGHFKNLSSFDLNL